MSRRSEASREELIVWVNDLLAEREQLEVAASRLRERLARSEWIVCAEALRILDQAPSRGQNG